MKNLMSILLVFLVSACASAPEPTEEKFESNIKSWVGQPYEKLIYALGIPTSEFKIDEKSKLIEYSNKSDTAYRNINGASIPLTFSCTTTFSIRENVVIGYKYSGNSCRSN